jgi:hypothetical protein
MKPRAIAIEAGKLRHPLDVVRDAEDRCGKTLGTRVMGIRCVRGRVKSTVARRGHRQRGQL